MARHTAQTDRQKGIEICNFLLKDPDPQVQFDAAILKKSLLVVLEKERVSFAGYR